MTLPRIALIHFHLESNRAAPITDRADFAAQRLVIGEAFAADVAKVPPVVSAGTRGFMDSLGAFEPVPVFAAFAGAGGMMDGGFLKELLQVVRDRLPADVDGVYLDAHGACIATDDEDPDGTMITLIRDIIGPDTPLVTTLDLHAHVSPAMIAGADFIAAYRTNPHVDQYDRGVEAAGAMQRLLTGARTGRALVRLPFIPPSTTLDTTRGPYGEMMQDAVARATGAIWNVSLCAGFSVGDSAKAGVNVTVTADDAVQALATAREIGQRFWNARQAFQIRLTALEDAITLMGDHATPRIYGDVADNPGGGGRGNTLAILQAMLAADVTNALFGMLFDPALAHEAAAQGEGAVFRAAFNRDETYAESGKLTAEVEVLQVTQGPVACRRGLYAGGQQDLGLCALLRCKGVLIIVASIRRQLCEPAFVERFGLDIGDFNTVVVKSRGHFRAGFDEYFPPAQVVEIDGPGLTSPELSRIAFAKTPRPIHPIDAGVMWHAEDSGDVAGVVAAPDNG
ncbi:M81 family metallopeptidase [Shimia sp. R11_0]|uniref:M81 family metallopeptidase n=1 Tax=Shimia sp. R11_0 TaxID=2821096 RepID=UPI001ADC0C77|nr:M81 family metallopeptidase [Shimia sp. R11_0]MBO9477859.1 M81 family metallopeptidase [Shimia sp. R11_0]